MDPSADETSSRSTTQSLEGFRELLSLPYQSLDENGAIVAVNDEWEDLLGYEEEEIVGQRFREFLPEDSRQRFLSELWDSIEDGERHELEVIRADGTRLPITFRGRVEPEETGEAGRIHCLFSEGTVSFARKSDSSETRSAFRHLFNGINDAVFVHDLSGEIIRVNRTACDRLGYTADELRGMDATDLDAPGHSTGIADRLAILQQDGSLTFETVHVTKSGAKIPVEISSSLIELFGETVAMSVARDISERRQREKDSELFRTLINQANDSVLVIDETTGDIVDVNQRACEMLGYQRTDLLSRTISDISDKFDTLQEYLEHVSREDHEQISGLIHEQKRADGSTFPVEVSARSTSIADEQYRVAIVRDISDRVEREQKLQRMKQAVDASGHAIYVTDADGTIEYVNPAFEDITGYSETEALGENPRILNSGEMSDAYFDRLWETVLSGEIWEEEVINRRKSGEKYHAHQTIAPMSDLGGEISGFVAIQTETTERKRREDKLEKREQILRELHQTTQNLLAVDSESAVFDEIVAALPNAFGTDSFGVLRFDDDRGVLQPIDIANEISDRFDPDSVIEPGDDPLWDVFREGKSRKIVVSNSERYATETETPDDLIAVPVGDFGVIVTTVRSGEPVPDVDLESLEVLAANAESVLGRLEDKTRLAEIDRNLAAKESRLREFEELIQAIDSIQHRLVESETKEAVQSAVCSELASLDRVDFAWIGQPETRDRDLTHAAVAGTDRGFLDIPERDETKPEFPAQSAATRRSSVHIENISQLVSREPWAKEAISRGFRSVFSVPLLYDGVLYGVLTVYSSQTAAFDQIYRDIFEEIGLLLANYLSHLNSRLFHSRANQIELEFSVPDTNFPLFALANQCGCTLSFDTVLETLESSVRLLVTVEDGDIESVLEMASEMVSVRSVEIFGKPKRGQLAIELRKPFLATIVAKHGGRLVGSTASPQDTTIRITVADDVSVRPLAESLSNRYSEIELRARREIEDTVSYTHSSPDELLTERQFEIVEAAYFGGYYESPRGVTGEGLAESFDISNSVVHDHLQGAHKRILRALLESDNVGRNS